MKDAHCSQLYDCSLSLSDSLITLLLSFFLSQSHMLGLISSFPRSFSALSHSSCGDRDYNVIYSCCIFMPGVAAISAVVGECLRTGFLSFPTFLSALVPLTLLARVDGGTRMDNLFLIILMYERCHPSKTGFALAKPAFCPCAHSESFPPLSCSESYWETGRGLKETI